MLCQNGIDEAATIYHAICQGNARLPTFLTPDYYHAFIRDLSQGLEKYQSKLAFSFTDSRGNTSQTIYDSQGYPRQEIDIFGNATTYSFWDGQLSGTSDADGNSTSFSYDTFGNVNGVTQSNSRAGTSTSTSFVYNTFGDLIGTQG